MGQIQILDAVTANQIAAGEVVERPSSVVKELIENALDAGASQIDVYIEEGGIQKIVVVDDGSGMSAEDAALCFSRYATSKLRKVDDLQVLKSFGFRGEALPSIASVSKVRLTTRLRNQAVASDVQIEGGQFRNISEAGGTLGTRIEISQLFYNTPARLKFLKSVRSEAAHVEDVVRSAALSQPHIGFSFRNDAKNVFNVSACPKDAGPENARRIERAVRVLGEDSRPHLYSIYEKSDLLTLSGYVASPLFTRRDFRGVHLFVNGRPIFDRQLLQTVKVAYRSLLEIGRFPVCALNIEINPSMVDVNVHPQKLEVRFSDAHAVQGQIIRFISNFLAGTPWLNQKVDRVYSLQSHPQPPAQANEKEDARAYGFTFQLKPSLSAATSLQSFEAPMVEKVPVQPGLGGEKRYEDLKFVGQVASTYLVLETENAMVVVDQHAAHERVMFEYFRDKAQKKDMPSQPLLFPIQLEVSSRQIAGLLENRDRLAEFGFEVEPFGERQVLVRAAPPAILAEKVRELVLDALDELAQLGRVDSLDGFRDHICAQLACHGSVRAGQKLGYEEATALLKQLDTVDYGAHCPHGRPVVRAIPFTEMQKWFSRL